MASLHLSSIAPILNISCFRIPEINSLVIIIRSSFNLNLYTALVSRQIPIISLLQIRNWGAGDGSLLGSLWKLKVKLKTESRSLGFDASTLVAAPTFFASYCALSSSKSVLYANLYQLSSWSTAFSSLEIMEEGFLQNAASVGWSSRRRFLSIV